MVENEKLFVVDPDKPIKFTIANQQDMLNIKKNQLSRKIKNHGGIEIPFDKKDEECIILAQKYYDSMDEDIFDLKYVTDCVNQNKVLNLQDYRLNNKKNRSTVLTSSEQNGECPFARKILSMKKSIRTLNRPAEEDLRIIQQL